MDDQLKGAALAATWPEHVTADELFDALTAPKKTNFMGEYRRFLWSDFAARLRPLEMMRALQWARNHTKKAAATTPLGRAAVSVVALAIECFQDPQVCGHLADILVQLAQTRVPALQVMSKLSSNGQARTAIAQLAIRVAPDVWSARYLRSYGLVEEGDVAFLLSELEAGPSNDVLRRRCCTPLLRLGNIGEASRCLHLFTFDVARRLLNIQSTAS